MTIRSHLMALAVAAVVPVFAFGVFASLALIDHERETQRSGAVDQARAMSTAVDAQLRGSIATLQALSASRALAADDLPGFHGAATRVLATQPTWLNVTLADPSGRQIVNLATAAGAPLGEVPDPASVERTVATLEPQVGAVVMDRLRGEAGVPVRVPVVRGGKAAYVLTAILRPDAFREIIDKQHLAPGWISGIVDRNLRFVARLPAVAAGSPASEGFRAAAARGKEGWYRGLTVEGVDTFTAHITSPFSGWTIGLAIPTPVVEAAARRSAAFTAIGALFAIAVAIAASVVVGRRIAGPIRSLATAARSLGTGGKVTVEDAGRVQEVAAVAAALQDAEVAVREREGLMQREKEALQASDAAKDEFLAMLSHELRNPLAALTSAAHLLQVLEPGHPSSVRARSVIERQTAHMTRLIEDLLDVSRIRLGRASLTKHRLDLADAVARAVDTWRTSGRLSRHRVELVSAEVSVVADRERIDQIVSNLLDNAVKFTPEGGRITVTVGPADGSARIVVADDGEGIAPDVIGRVFDLFVQGPHGIDRRKGGMGIGLALVKRLTEMHGGTVSVHSDGAGKGATFTVALPIAQGIEAQPRSAPAPAVPAARRILIIEDNDDARVMLAEALALRGHEVKQARDGKTGLLAVKESSPDVALIDIGLPDIDGYEVARRVRESSDARISLIALSGYGQPEDRHLARDAGFELHLTKPVDVERLEDAIAALLAGSRRFPLS